MGYRKVHEFDFSNGVAVGEKQIKEFHKSVKSALMEKDRKFAWCATGNSLVIGVKNSDGEIHIFECNNGYETTEYERVKSIKVKGLRRNGKK